VRADVERATARLAAARDRARRLETVALPEARRAAEGVAFAYARGAIGLTDLLDARRQQAAVRAEDVLARAEYAKALADARAALATEETP
jgi:cobalt-zinc-cadmium efflux system outer membrane protein